VGDAFTKNLVIVRAEKRVGLAINRPEAMITGSIAFAT
jgi:hypothetical protein